MPALLLVPLTPGRAVSIPHQPLTLTWQLPDPHGDLIKQISSLFPLGIWFPDIVFDLCEIVSPDYSTADLGYSNPHGGCGADHLRRASFYVFPGWHRSKGKISGGPVDYFCKEWGC